MRFEIVTKVVLRPINTIRYFLLIALIFAVCVPGFTARAETVDWINGTIVGEKDETDKHYKIYGDCGYEAVSIEVSLGAYRPVTECVFAAKSFRYAIIDGRLFIQATNDTAMRPLIDWGFASRNNVIPSPETDDFIFGSLIVRDLLQSTTLVTNTSSLHYVENIGSSYNIVRDENGNVGYTLQGTGVSRNGRWLVVNVKNIGLVKFNLATMGATRIAPYSSQLTMLAISNDGNSVAESSDANHNQPVVYRVDGCGESGATLQSTWYNASLLNPCQSRNLYSDINDVLGVDFSTTYDKPAFTDGGKLEFYTFGYGASEATKVTLRITNQDTAPRLDYLALGDSYSSGEGDIDNGFWYKKGTENRDGCHLSLRSYPYLLRDAWGIDTDKMASVACSGAKVLPDYYGSGLYYGQRKELLSKSSDVRVGMQGGALGEFIPGVVRQIDFVSTYKPKILTFTGGGNDVGFADIINYCAASYKLAGLLPLNETCAYASDSQMRADLNQMIDGQYGVNKQFIERVKEASPSTKIYMIGYPQFIKDDAFCFTHSEILNNTERKFIRDEVTRMNNVLKRVARDTGVYYVDIEDSFSGGQICEGSNYVTGPVKLGYSKLRDGYVQESYHPNAKGHQKIADSIQEAINSGMEYDILDIPDETNGRRTVQTAVMPGYVGISSTTTITVDSGMFKPDGVVTIELYSKQTSLATVRTDSKGKLTVQVTIPKEVGIGDHLLALSGLDENNEPLLVRQYVRVISGINGDDDDDGLPDELDACFVIQEWYVNGENLCETNKTNDVSTTKEAGTIPSTDLIDTKSIKWFEEAVTNELPKTVSQESPVFRQEASRSSRDSGKQAINWWFLIVVCIIAVGIGYGKKRSKILDKTKR